MKYRFVAIVSLPLFALFAVNTVLSILLPLVQKDLLLTPYAIGLLVASYGWAITFMQVPAGVLIDRFDVRKILSFSMLLLFASSVWFSQSHDLFMLSLSRFFSGFASSFVFLAGIKALERYYAVKERGTALGLFIAMSGVGGAFASYASPFLIEGTSLGWRGVTVVMGLVALTAALAMFLLPGRREQPGALSKREVPFVAVLARAGRSANWWIQNAISFAFFGSYFGILFFLPLFLQQQGFTLVYSGTAVALLSIGSVPGSIVAGWWCDRVGRRNPAMRAFMVVYTLMMALILVGPYYGPARLLFLPVTFILGFGWGGLTAQTRLVVELFPVEIMSTAFGITNMLRWLGFALYPLTVGFLLSLGYPFSVAFLPGLVSMVVSIALSLASRETRGERAGAS